MVRNATNQHHQQSTLELSPPKVSKEGTWGGGAVGVLALPPHH